MSLFLDLKNMGEELANFNLKHIKSRPVGLFLGSGASYPYPSQLPTFHHILKEWLFYLSDFLSNLSAPRVTEKQKTELVMMLRVMPPEAIFQVMDSCQRRKLQRALIATLNCREPNTTHYITVRILKNGGTIWTTNFDTLIEQAAGIKPKDSCRIAFDKSKVSVFADKNIHLIKPHGTLPLPETWVFRSEDVLQPAPQVVRDRLIQDIKNHYMIFLGYSASDLDLRPVLQEAVEDTGLGIWFCKPGEVDWIRKLFPIACGNGRLTLSAAEDPSRNFWDWAKDKGLLENIPERLPVPRPNVKPLSKLLDDSVICATLFRRMGALSIALQALRPGLIRFRFGALNLYLSINRQQLRCLGLITHFLRAVFRIILWPLRNKGLYSLSYMAFEVGRYGLAARIAQIDRAHATIKRNIQLTASLRMSGKLEEALKVIEDIIAGAEKWDSASLEARAVFEKAMSLRWLGRECEAMKAMDNLSKQRLKHADLSWQGWFHFEKGTCLSLQGEMEAAGKEVSEAERIFTVATNPLGRVDTLLLKCTVCRFTSQIKEAWKVVKTIEALLGFSGRGEFAREALEFEKGELLRQESRYREAENSYHMLLKSRSKLHQCHGALGMAELEKDRGNYGEARRWSVMAREGYQKLGCRWGECNAIYTLVLIGGLDQSKAQAAAEKTGYTLPKGKLEGLLFEQGSDHRPLNLP